MYCLQSNPNEGLSSAAYASRVTHMFDNPAQSTIVFKGSACNVVNLSHMDRQTPAVCPIEDIHALYVGFILTLMTGMSIVQYVKLKYVRAVISVPIARIVTAMTSAITSDKTHVR